MGRALHFFPRTCGVLVLVLATLWMAGCGGGATSTGGSNGANGGGSGSGSGGNTGGGTGSPSITVSVSPKRVAVAMSTQAQPFTATVTEDPQNLGVTWTVDNVKGGNATVGTISQAGVYTPPATVDFTPSQRPASPTQLRARRFPWRFLIFPVFSPGTTIPRVTALIPTNLRSPSPP